MSARYIRTPRGWSLPLTREDVVILCRGSTEAFHRRMDCIDAERADTGYLHVAMRFAAPSSRLGALLPGVRRRMRRVAMATIGDE